MSRGTGGHINPLRGTNWNIWKFKASTLERYWRILYRLFITGVFFFAFLC